MTPLGELTEARQQAIVYVANAALKHPGEWRLDVANVPREVMSGVFERLRDAGATWRVEGRFLVVHRS